MIKLLFGMKLDEVRNILNSFEGLKNEVELLTQEKQRLDKESQELKAEIVGLQKQLDKAERRIKAQDNKCEVLDNKIQSSDKWIKDTREKLWNNKERQDNINTVLQEKVEKTNESIRGIKDNLESRIKKVDESQKLDSKVLRDNLETRIVKINESQQLSSEWLKKTRDQMWDISRRVSDTQKWKEEVRKLDFKLKKYIPESKYEKAIVEWYYEQTGKVLDMQNPRTYNDLIQWSKLHDNVEEKSRLADKYAVREWIAEKIGEEYLIPLLGVWQRAEDIDFDVLPNQFVLKCNHGSAYNIIVQDKNTLDIEKTVEQLNLWLHEDFAFKGFELHYANVKPCIIAEEYIVCDGIDDLPDYKFFCFGGKAYCSYVRIDHGMSHSEGKVGFFDRDYKLMPYCRKDFPPITEQIEKPLNYDKMLELAEILAEGFSHVRVDLYNLNGKIYFGEMTFTPANGKGLFEPDEFDYILGEQWLKYLPELQQK